MPIVTTVECDGCGTTLPGSDWQYCITATGMNGPAPVGIVVNRYFGEICGCATKLRTYLPTLMPGFMAGTSTLTTA